MTRFWTIVSVAVLATLILLLGPTQRHESPGAHTLPKTPAGLAPKDRAHRDRLRRLSQMREDRRRLRHFENACASFMASDLSPGDLRSLQTAGRLFRPEISALTLCRFTSDELEELMQRLGQLLAQGEDRKSTRLNSSH